MYHPAAVKKGSKINVRTRGGVDKKAMTCEEG